MNRRELDFQRPPELQAATPAECRGLERDQVRLLVTTPQGHHHGHFRDLPRFLTAGSVLVVRDVSGQPKAALLGLGSGQDARRKRFIGDISGDPVHERLAGSLVAVREAMKLPKRIVRVHDVAQTRQFILVQQAVRIHRAARLRGQA